MLLVIGAAAFQLTVLRAAAREPPVPRGRIVASGAAGLLLWLGLAVTACAFILLE